MAIAGHTGGGALEGEAELVGHGEIAVADEELAEVARARGGEVVQWRARQPSFAFYLGRPTPSGEPAAGQLALVRKDRLTPEDDVVIVAEKRGFALVEKTERKANP